MFICLVIASGPFQHHGQSHYSTAFTGRIPVVPPKNVEPTNSASVYMTKQYCSQQSHFACLVPEVQPSSTFWSRHADQPKLHNAVSHSGSCYANYVTLHHNSAGFCRICRVGEHTAVQPTVSYSVVQCRIGLAQQMHHAINAVIVKSARDVWL